MQIAGSTYRFPADFVVRVEDDPVQAGSLVVTLGPMQTDGTDGRRFIPAEVRLTAADLADVATTQSTFHDVVCYLRELKLVSYFPKNGNTFLAGGQELAMGDNVIWNAVYRTDIDRLVYFHSPSHSPDFIAASPLSADLEQWNRLVDLGYIDVEGNWTLQHLVALGYLHHHPRHNDSVHDHDHEWRLPLGKDPILNTISVTAPNPGGPPNEGTGEYATIPDGFTVSVQRPSDTDPNVRITISKQADPAASTTLVFDPQSWTDTAAVKQTIESAVAGL